MARQWQFANLFDKFKFGGDSERVTKDTTEITTDRHDGAIEVDDLFHQYALKVNWEYSSQAELIETYREISNFDVVDFAIEDIINEAVSFSDDENPVELDLSDVDDKILSESMKEKVYESWDKIVSLLELNDNIHRRLRSFYVDGRLSYQKAVNRKKLNDGLTNIVELDPKFITKVRNIQYDQQSKTIDGFEEYYIYNENIHSKKGRKETDKNSQKMYDEGYILDKDMITYITSGMLDKDSGLAIGWLHKAVKPANQQRLMENALVIYRITRAPERRLFYVDTTGMPNTRAKKHIESMKNNYRNRMSFNPETGTFKDEKHFMTMQEDFWLPRNSNGRGTEVDTLPGGQNLDQIEDVLYFQKKLYRALNIPISRLEPESMVSLGRAQEISRDELKLSKLVSKIRKRFNMMFLDILKTELILTKVITAKEWNEFSHLIKFTYAQDLYLEELKKSEMMRDRLELLEQYQPYIGKYISHKKVREDILKQTDVEMKEEDEQIAKEKEDTQYQGDEEGGSPFG